MDKIKIICRNIFFDEKTKEYFTKVKGRILRDKSKKELKRLARNFEENYPKYQTEYEANQITNQLDKEIRGGIK